MIVVVIMRVCVCVFVIVLLFVYSSTGGPMSIIIRGNSSKQARERELQNVALHGSEQPCRSCQCGARDVYCPTPVPFLGRT